jgi:GNAT superfamily N-acetyltransferase
MIVRPASLEDLPSIRLLAAGMPWTDGGLLEKSIAAGHMTVGVVETAVRGFIVSNTRFFEKAFVWLVFVDASYRRTGVATELFAAVEAHHVGRHVYTSTNRSNETMAAFLEARGYVTIGELDLDPSDPEVFYRSR